MRRARIVAAAALLVLLGGTSAPAWSDPASQQGGLSISLDLGRPLGADVLVRVGDPFKGKIVLRNDGPSAILVPAKQLIRLQVLFREEGAPQLVPGDTRTLTFFENDLQTLAPKEEFAQAFEVDVRRAGAGRLRAELHSSATSFVRVKHVWHGSYGTGVQEVVESDLMWRGSIEASAAFEALPSGIEHLKHEHRGWKALARVSEVPVADVTSALGVLLSFREHARNETGVVLLARILHSDAPASVRELCAAMILLGVKEGWAPQGVGILLELDAPTTSTAMQELRLEAAGLGARGYLSAAIDVRGVAEVYSSNLPPAIREASARILKELAAGPEGWLRRRAEALLRDQPGR